MAAQTVHVRLAWPKHRTSGPPRFDPRGKTPVPTERGSKSRRSDDCARNDLSASQPEWTRPDTGVQQDAVGKWLKCKLTRVEHRVGDDVGTIFYDTPDWDRRLLGTERPKYIDTLKHRGRIGDRRVHVVTHVYTLVNNERVGVTYVYSKDRVVSIHEDDFDEF